MKFYKKLTIHYFDEKYTVLCHIDKQRGSIDYYFDYFARFFNWSIAYQCLYSIV